MMPVLTIAIIFYLCPKFYRFFGIGLGSIVNRQEFRNLFLVFKLSQPIVGLLYLRQTSP